MPEASSIVGRVDGHITDSYLDAKYRIIKASASEWISIIRWTGGQRRRRHEQVRIVQILRIASCGSDLRARML